MKRFDFDEMFTAMMKKNSLTRVVILGHINPDGDAAGSVLGLAHYIHSVWPDIQVLPYLSEKLDKGPKRVAEQDSIFHPFTTPEALTEPYGVIVCDTATRARIAGTELYEGAAAAMVLDHHASNEGYGMINNTRISESCAENIFYMLNKDKLRASAEQEADAAGFHAAEYIYLGMIHDTDGFSRADESTLLAAADLQSMGVSHKKIMKTLKTETYEDYCKRMELMKKAVRVMDGKIAYVAADRKECEEKDITYQDIHPISGLLRDCEDIELGMTFYEEAPGLWRCSFRSDGVWINVNELLLPFGGGGHAGAAGLRKPTDEPEELIRQILKAAEEMRKIIEGND